jgi:REP element-mobilizing transposase RayT
MSDSYKIKGDGVYYMTFQIVGWVDLFTRKSYRDIIIDSLKFCQKNKGLTLYAYVIMSNHMHLMAQNENSNLEGIVRDFKNHTAKSFLIALNANEESRKDWMKMVFEYHAKYQRQSNQIWTHENHSEYIYSQKFIEQKLDYIHNNPVRAGIVLNPEDYLYSSARNYADLDGLIEVVLLTKLWKTVK